MILTKQRTNIQQQNPPHQRKKKADEKPEVLEHLCCLGQAGEAMEGGGQVHGVQPREMLRSHLTRLRLRPTESDGIPRGLEMHRALGIRKPCRPFVFFFFRLSFFWRKTCVELLGGMEGFCGFHGKNFVKGAGGITGPVFSDPLKKNK